MRYYATCIDRANKDIMIVVKGNTEEEALDYLHSKYKIQQVIRISTTAPHQEKSYYASIAGVHYGAPIVKRIAGKGGAYSS